MRQSLTVRYVRYATIDMIKRTGHYEQKFAYSLPSNTGGAVHSCLHTQRCGSTSLRNPPPYSTFSAPSGTPASIASAVGLDDDAPAALAPRYIEWRTCTGVGPLTRL